VNGRQASATSPALPQRGHTDAAEAPIRR